MLKPTKRKAVVFLVLSAVVLGPLFLFGNGPAVIVPVLAIFWLDALVQAQGVEVSVNGGVDAFNLIPPNAIGTVLIVLGSAASLTALYVVAAWLGTISFRRPET